MKNFYTRTIAPLFSIFILSGNLLLYAAISSTQTGNWSSADTWAGGVIPSGSDDVVISSGNIVTIDIAARCMNLTINGTLQFADPAPSASLTVNGNLTVAPAGTWRAAASADNYKVNWTSISGNLEIDGTFISQVSGLSTSRLGISMKGDSKHISGSNLNFAGYLEIDVGASGSLILNSPISISGTLYLIHGTLDNTANNFTLENNAGLWRWNEDGTVAAAPAFSGSQQYFYYKKTMTTGPELPDIFERLYADGSDISITLSKDIEIARLCLYKSKILTGAYTVTIDDPVSGCDSISYVVGNLARKISSAGNYLFPLGDINNYGPLTITYTSAPSSAGIVTVSKTTPDYFGGDLNPHLMDGSYEISRRSNQYWTVSQTSITGGAYDLSIDGSVQTGVTNPSELRIIHSNDGVNFDLVGSHSAGENTLIKRTGIDGSVSGRFYIGGNITENTLPVELISFSCEFVPNTVRVNWSTASEINNYGFEIERKVMNTDNGVWSSSKYDGNPEWNKIGFVKGAGSSISEQKYSFTDDLQDVSVNGKYLYRIKQIDLDGNCSYSTNVEINVNIIPGKFSLGQNYPNPFNPITSIQYALSSKQFVALKIYDAIGNEAAVLVNEEKPAGEYRVQFDAAGLPSGIYFYRIQAGNFIQTKK